MTESSIYLVSVQGVEHHRPTMCMPSGHGERLRRRILKNDYSKYSVLDFTEWILVSLGNRPVVTGNTLRHILLSVFWFIM